MNLNKVINIFSKNYERIKDFFGTILSPIKAWIHIFDGPAGGSLSFLRSREKKAIKIFLKRKSKILLIQSFESVN